MTLPRISIAARTRCGIDASAGTLSSTLSNGHLPIKKRQPALLTLLCLPLPRHQGTSPGEASCITNAPLLAAQQRQHGSTEAHSGPGSTQRHCQRWRWTRPASCTSKPGAGAPEPDAELELAPEPESEPEPERRGG